MSRHGYNDDIDQWQIIKWRGQVTSAIRGKRGQAFLLEMWRAMQALPAQRLLSGELESEYDGSVCAIGSVGRARGVDMAQLDSEDFDGIAATFGIPHQLAQEIMYLNDEGFWASTPEERFTKMKTWIENNLRPVEDVALTLTS